MPLPKVEPFARVSDTLSNIFPCEVKAFCVTNNCVPIRESCTKWEYPQIKCNSVCNNRCRRPSLILYVSNRKKLALMTEIIKAKFNQESISGRLCAKQKKNQPSLLKQPFWASGIYLSPPYCLAWSMQKIIANVAAFHSNDINHSALEFRTVNFQGQLPAVITSMLGELRTTRKRDCFCTRKNSPKSQSLKQANSDGEHFM